MGRVQGNIITEVDVSMSSAAGGTNHRTKSLEEIEKEHILAVLIENQWNIARSRPYPRYRPGHPLQQDQEIRAEKGCGGAEIVVLRISIPVEFFSTPIVAILKRRISHHEIV